MKKSKPQKVQSAEPKALDTVVISDDFKRRSFISRLNKKQRLIISAVVLVALAGVGTFFALTSNKGDKDANVADDPSYTMKTEEYAKVSAQSLAKSPPPENAAPADLAEYYDEFITQNFLAKNYQSSVDAYQRYVQQSDDRDISFRAYQFAAQSYIALGNKAEALKVIERAEKYVQQTESDPEIRASYMTSLTELKESAQL